MAALWIIALLAFTRSVLGEECGVPAITPVVSDYNRIINGEDAVPHSWPWQVSLQDRTRFHFCGGSIINELWVITAAHCSVIPNSDVAVLGEHSRVSDEEDIQTIDIVKFIIHPEYSSSVSADVALVKLKSPAVIQPHVSPVCLAFERDVFPENLKCITTGWGAPALAGDSGGPLVCQVGGSWHLVGIVSWGSSSCNIKLPAVYARVSYVRQWVDNTIASE